MPKTLQIGNESFEYPLQGDGNYGEEATAWAEAVTNSLQTVQGSEDILLTEAILNNGSSGNVSGLSFDVGIVKQVNVEGFINRTYSDATPTESEAFNAIGAYNGTTFNVSLDYTGNNTGVILDCSNSGQFTYTAESKANTNTITIKFKAKAIVQE